MRRYMQSVSMLILLMLIIGCGIDPKVPDSAMPGTYTVTYSPYSGTVLATEKLVLGANGTYEQTFTPKTGKPWKHTGHWSVDRSSGHPATCLNDYMQTLDFWGNRLLPKPKRTNWHRPVVYRYGVVTILIYEDAGYYFAKSP